MLSGSAPQTPIPTLSCGGRRRRRAQRVVVSTDSVSDPRRQGSGGQPGQEPPVNGGICARVRWLRRRRSGGRRWMPRSWRAWVSRWTVRPLTPNRSARAVLVIPGPSRQAWAMASRRLAGLAGQLDPARLATPAARSSRSASAAAATAARESVAEAGVGRLRTGGPGGGAGCCWLGSASRAVRAAAAELLLSRAARRWSAGRPPRPEPRSTGRAVKAVCFGALQQRLFDRR